MTPLASGLLEYLLLVAIYFLPTLVAALRGVLLLDIAVANYLFGWTIAGWFVALWVALSRDPEVLACRPIGSHPREQ